MREGSDRESSDEDTTILKITNRNERAIEFSSVLSHIKLPGSRFSQVQGAPQFHIQGFARMQG